MAETNNFECFKGEAVELDLTQVTAGTTTPVNINGWTLVFTVRRKPTTASLLSVAGVILVAGSGTYKIPLSHAQTNGLTAGTYVYDIQRTDAGSEAVLSIGQFRINQEVLYP